MNVLDEVRCAALDMQNPAGSGIELHSPEMIDEDKLDHAMARPCIDTLELRIEGCIDRIMQCAHRDSMQ